MATYDARMDEAGQSGPEQSLSPRRGPEGGPSSWLDAPHNRQTMWNIHEVAATHMIRSGEGQGRGLPARPFDCDTVPVARVDGSNGTVRDILDDTFTDAFAVLQDGSLVSEHYAGDGGPERRHAVLSVTKSVVGCVAGVLLDRGVLEEHRAIGDYVPELATSGYAGATVRHLLDMRSGVRFVEDYADPIAHIRVLDEWLGEQGLYAYLATLEADRPHGGPFLYRSSETDVLGWTCERASGTTMADLVSELVWEPMGAEHDAEIMCDARGTAVHDGGLAATARDLLRFGQLLLDGGTVPLDGGARAVLPGAWMRQAWAVDADVRGAFAASPAELAFPGGWYRNQCWFRVGALEDALLCLGIHGQLLYVGRRTRTVCVKLSSWPDAQNPAFQHDALRACEALGAALTGQDLAGDVHRLRGVVAGLSRGGGRRPPGPHVV